MEWILRSSKCLFFLGLLLGLCLAICLKFWFRGEKQVKRRQNFETEYAKEEQISGAEIYEMEEIKAHTSKSENVELHQMESINLVEKEQNGNQYTPTHCIEIIPFDNTNSFYEGKSLVSVNETTKVNMELSHDDTEKVQRFNPYCSCKPDDSPRCLF